MLPSLTRCESMKDSIFTLLENRPLIATMMLSRHLTRQTLRLSRQFSTRAIPSATSHRAAFAFAAITCGATLGYNLHTDRLAHCSAPLGSEPVMLSPKAEEATGILFPRLCNGMTLAGCGVRVKWGFVKVRWNVVQFVNIIRPRQNVQSIDICSDVLLQMSW